MSLIDYKGRKCFTNNRPFLLVGLNFPNSGHVMLLGKFAFCPFISFTMYISLPELQALFFLFFFFFMFCTCLCSRESREKTTPVMQAMFMHLDMATIVQLKQTILWSYIT